MTLIIIAALAKNRAIGYQNRLLYHLPEDMQHFKRLTQGHTVVMGRRTFESLPKGALPNRRNIVLTRADGFAAENTEAYKSLEEALSHCAPEETVYIIGGASVYAKALPLADRLNLTWIDDTPEHADTYFPEIPENDWKEVGSERHPADESHAHAFRFTEYERKN